MENSDEKSLEEGEALGSREASGRLLPGVEVTFSCGLRLSIQQLSGDTWLMLSTSGAPADFLGMQQKEQVRHSMRHDARNRL